ncbi:MAG: type II toxin-antitoxin system RelB/DinJ family antitoxin [Proteobacteria bacterium]|nr:type II toxin-antitoxin system RelB/DinJ family antitoxin [Pseudomonadota bacterium]
MAKTAMIRARTDPELKEDVNTIFRELGLNETQAINLFYNQVRIRRGLPFNVEIPNKITLNTFKKTDQGKDIIECKNAKDMFKKLGV